MNNSLFSTIKGVENILRMSLAAFVTSEISFILSSNTANSSLLF